MKFLEALVGILKSGLLCKSDDEMSTLHSLHPTPEFSSSWSNSIEINAIQYNSIQVNLGQIRTSPPFTAFPLFICFRASVPVQRVSCSWHSQLRFLQLSEKI
uniref:Uncharacterized protein n=1 Tax=Glossina palpalis gambiensis TaxID=67801 RepID=A0A1B0ATW5_9MUSC